MSRSNIKIKVSPEETNLLPCPFCGGKAKLIEELYQEADDCGGERKPEFDEFYVQCDKCNFVRSPQWGTVAYSAKLKAIKGWNKRVDVLVKNESKIKARIKEILADERLAYKTATVDMNAPLALIQLSMTTQLHTLQNVLGVKLTDINKLRGED